MRTVTADVYVAALDVPGIKMFLPQVCAKGENCGREVVRERCGMRKCGNNYRCSSVLERHISHPFLCLVRFPPSS